MPEIWLRSNRRVFLVGMTLAGLLAVGAGGAAAAAWRWQWGGWWIAAGIGLALAALFWLASLAWWMTVPRLAYEAGKLLVYLDRREPVCVPIDVVECFFLGQGASQLPPLAGREPETANVIVRIAESAHEWHHREVNPRLAHWCEGYITLAGAWCEPIDADRLLTLNRRLAEIHRQWKEGRLAEPEPFQAPSEVAR
jgi:hypothetical protein